MYKRQAIITIGSSFFISCDDDISEVGSGTLIGSELNTISREFDVTSSQLNFTQPQSNNLEYNLLGTNNQTNFNILTQINSISGTLALRDSFTQTLDDDDNNLDEDGNFKIASSTDTFYTLDEITLVIPLRYGLLDDDNDLNDGDSSTRQYNIDSEIIGPGPLIINVFESQFLLQQINPESSDFQIYYADGSDGPNPFINSINGDSEAIVSNYSCLLYTSPSPRD